MWNQKKDVIEYALSYIFRYPKTEKELVLQLRKKWYDEKNIEKAVKYLKSKKYLNDKNFVKEYIYYHLIKKWKPISYVKYQLLNKWVDMLCIKEIIQENIDDINKWIWKKIKKDIEKYKEKWINKLDIIDKLLRKWYTLNQIKKVVEES